MYLSNVFFEQTTQDSAHFIDTEEKYKTTALEGHSQKKRNRKQNSPGCIGTSIRETQQLNSPGWIGTSTWGTQPLKAEEHVTQTERYQAVATNHLTTHVVAMKT